MSGGRLLRKTNDIAAAQEQRQTGLRSCSKDRQARRRHAAKAKEQVVQRPDLALPGPTSMCTAMSNRAREAIARD